MSETLIRIENLTKRYDNVTPLSGVNLDIHKGEIIAIIGPSGTGKSTLIRMINRMETPTEGSIFFGGEDITAPGCRIDLVRRKIGMIFQSFNLFPHLTVIENIMSAPISLLHMSRQQAYEQAMTLLKSVGLQSKALNYPTELSGGQQQRIAIVRALAMKPEILLFDEPTSALDPTMVGEVESVISRIAREGVTMMIVTHSMDFARKISNRVLYLDEGGIYEEGSPEQIFEHPLKEKTRQFIHRLKVLNIYIDSHDVDLLGCNTTIEEFCAKNDIVGSTRSALISLFEEVCVVTLLPRLSKPCIKVTVEYGRDGILTAAFDYNGERFDVRESDDDISLAIIKSHAARMEYSYQDGDTMPNHLLIQLKE